MAALESGNVSLLSEMSKTGRANIHALFKGFPTFPEYVKDATAVAGWDIRYQSCGSNALGYFLPCSPLDEGIALLRNDETWMSITPLEVESHMLAQFGARGNVVVAGLGLGMIANSLLNKHSVKRLTVLEYDAELIANYSTLLVGESRKLWDESIASGRLQLIQCDCKKAIPIDVKAKIGAVDYMWVDIWANLGGYDALPDTKRLHKQLQPKVCDYWGMELDFIYEMQSRKLSASPASVLKVVDKLGFKNSVMKMNKKQARAYADLAVMASLHVLFGQRSSENVTKFK